MNEEAEITPKYNWEYPQHQKTNKNKKINEKAKTKNSSTHGVLIFY